MTAQARFAQVLACVVGVFLAVSTAGASGESANHTLEFFTPKINLDDVRFVYPDWGGAPKIELGNEQAMLGTEFVGRFPETNTMEFLNEKYDEAIERLPRRQERFVFDQIAEYRGQHYCVFFPDRFALGLFKLDGVAMKPTGDGALDGFWGRLKHIAGADFQDARPADYCAKPLAFPCDKLKGHARPMHTDVTDQDALNAILTSLGVCSELGSPEILKCTELYLAYPSQKGYLVQVRGERSESTEFRYHPTVLYCLVRTDDTFRIVPFPDGIQTKSEGDGGWLIEAEEGASYDLSPYDSKVYVLPDLDGDGCCEMYVVSTVSTVFRVVQKYDYEAEKITPRIAFVKETYFGP